MRNHDLGIKSHMVSYKKIRQQFKRITVSALKVI